MKSEYWFKCRECNWLHPASLIDHNTLQCAYCKDRLNTPLHGKHRGHSTKGLLYIKGKPTHKQLLERKLKAINKFK